MEESSNGTIERAEPFKSVFADADLDSSHSCMLGLVQSLLKDAKLVLRAKDRRDATTHLMMVLSRDEIKHLVVDLYDQHLIASLIFDDILVARVKEIFAPNNLETVYAT